MSFVKNGPMRALLMEFIGTFGLVFSIALNVTNGAASSPAIGIGFTLLFLVYIGGPISGAHFNPAVTLTELIMGRRSRTLMGLYVVAQAAAGAIAGICVQAIRGGASKIPKPAPLSNQADEIAVEMFFTFFLVLVSWKCGLSKAEVRQKNSYYGLAVAAVVISGISGAGSISGAVFNPAVAVGLCSLGVSQWSTIWIYVLAPCGGALLGLLAFVLLEDESDNKKAKRDLDLDLDGDIQRLPLLDGST